MQPTVHEMIQINEMLRMESTDVQKLQAVMPMVSDPDLRQEIGSCIENGSSRVKMIVDFCKEHGLAQTGGMKQ